MKRILFLILTALVAVFWVSAITAPVQAEPPTVDALASIAAADPQEDFENEKIEAALYASGYFRRDVPLDGDTQALLRSACEESGIPYELALAVIWKETGFQNVMGDDGASCGYMQVQERWHRDRMDRLGVSDLSDPAGNFRVGCDYLAELLDKYTLEEALTAYNSGSPGKSDYARSVVSYMGELEDA